MSYIPFIIISYILTNIGQGKVELLRVKITSDRQTTVHRNTSHFVCDGCIKRFPKKLALISFLVLFYA
jgi:hypothetical protein